MSAGLFSGVDTLLVGALTTQASETLSTATGATLGSLGLKDLLAVAFFGLVFVALFVAIHFRDHRGVRPAFAVGFVVLLLVVNVAPVFPPYPLVNWDKFSTEYDEVTSVYQLRAVDDAGREYNYDLKATMATDQVAIEEVARTFVEGDEPTRVALACHLTERARIHRDRVESRSGTQLLRYPPHHLEDMWTQADLTEFGPVVGIRLYRLDIETTPAGDAVESVTEVLLFDYDQPCGRVDATSAFNTHIHSHTHTHSRVDARSAWST